MKDPMLDEEFLRNLDAYPHHHLWAKIVALDFNEYPVDEISGRISTGNISVDGDSSVRRTCSLTLLSEDVNIKDFYWGLKTKFRLYVGLENFINNEYLANKMAGLEDSLNYALNHNLPTDVIEYNINNAEELYRYPDIVWFNQGTFVVSSFNCTAGINNYTVSIQGKDKMTLLNGDMGGVIPVSWDFGKINRTATDEEGKTAYDSTGYAIIETEDILIKDIILEAVHEFAQEPYQNIIVNDLDDYGIELLEYQGTTPLYYIIKQDASGDNDSREVSNMTINGDMPCMVQVVDWVDGKAIPLGWAHKYRVYEKTEDGDIDFSKYQDFDIKISELNFDPDTVLLIDTDTMPLIPKEEETEETEETEEEEISYPEAQNPPTYSYEKLVEQLDPTGKVTETQNYYRVRIAFDDDYYTIKEDDNEYKVYNEYTVAKITRDDINVCGYRICGIIYPYDLLAGPGDTVCTILDKLVQMLGNFEYFFDENGRFIFQKKRTYIDVSYNNIVNEHNISADVWANNSEFSSKYSYTFDKNMLVSSVQNNPNLSELKNDFTINGQRKTSGDTAINIHMRYALDKKPCYYKCIGHVHARDEDGNPLKDDYGDYIYLDAGREFYTEEYPADIQRRSGFDKIQMPQAEIGQRVQSILDREGYPSGLNPNWYKLDDWLFLYGVAKAINDKNANYTVNNLTDKIIEKYYPDATTHMSAGNGQHVLSTKSYQTMAQLREVFWDGDVLSNPDNFDVLYGEVVDDASLTYYQRGAKTSHLDGDRYITNIVDIYTVPLDGRQIIHSVEHGSNTDPADPDRENTGCYHTYTELLNRQKLYENITIYIYSPELIGELQDKGTLINADIVEILHNLPESGIVDWREIIYQMANDYRQHYHEPDFLKKVKENNMVYGSNYDSYYQDGYTGYEKYYIDFEMNSQEGVIAYWRELYNPDAINRFGNVVAGRYDAYGNFITDASLKDEEGKGTYDNEHSYKKGDLVSYPDPEKGELVIYRSKINDNLGHAPGPSNSGYWAESPGTMVYDSNGWNQDIINNPEKLNFWFDFIDTTGELNKYSVHNIGLRSKAVNDDKVKAIYFREVPNVIFETNDDIDKRIQDDVALQSIIKQIKKNTVLSKNDILKKIDETVAEYRKQYNWVKPGYCYINIPPAFENFFTISTRGKNCLDVVEEYLYKYVYPISSVTLSVIPIYHLSPNTLIYINDPDTGIIGEYILKKYSIQMGLASQMSISAVETTKRIY